MELINIISQYLQENGIDHKMGWQHLPNKSYISIPNADLCIMQGSQPNGFYITGSGGTPTPGIWARYNLADPEALPKLLQDIRISL